MIDHWPWLVPISRFSSLVMKFLQVLNSCTTLILVGDIANSPLNSPKKKSSYFYRLINLYSQWFLILIDFAIYIICRI